MFTSPDADPDDPLRRAIKEALALPGMSAAKMEREAGLSRSSISSILEGKSQHPRIDTLQKIANFLNVPLDKLTQRNALAEPAAHFTGPPPKDRNSQHEADCDQLVYYMALQLLRECNQATKSATVTALALRIRREADQLGHDLTFLQRVEFVVSELRSELSRRASGD